MNKIQLGAILSSAIILLASTGLFIFLDPLNLINGDNNNENNNTININNGINNTDFISPPIDNETITTTPFEWQYASPENQNFDPEKLNSLDSFVVNSLPLTKSVLIVRNGFIVFEKYYSGSNASLHNIFSVTKSITSILMGIAIDRGFIENEEVHVLDFFPTKIFQNVDDNKRNMTIFHLLTMTTGLQWEELAIPYSNPQNSWSQMTNTRDWTQFVLDLSMVYEPGTKYEYNTGASHILSAIIEQATGMNLLLFAKKYLFEPLSIKSTNIIWPKDGVGVYQGGSELHLNTKDMAKIGQLYLNNGTFNGLQIVSKEWVEKSIINYNEGAYGYQWRIHLNGYSALGYGSQRIYIVPRYSLVFVMTGTMYGNDIIPGDILVNNFAIPAIIS